MAVRVSQSRQFSHLQWESLKSRLKQSITYILMCARGDKEVLKEGNTETTPESNLHA